MTYNAASAYKNNSILTASPAELTLALYEGAIKFCNIALIGLENNDIEKVNTNLIKAQKIITEFRSTLDFKYEVAKDFDIVYEYINRRLAEGNIKKDAQIVEEALGHIRSMRDAWKEVMKLTKTNK
ncbi:MAG: flagellar export chaperone FliS [Lachnospiraceae bacterium]|nr:flagellar export chaperone FliS [Lachnospiraceae bacterium]